LIGSIDPCQCAAEFCGLYQSIVFLFMQSHS
jgi:hypothetical protein